MKFILAGAFSLFLLVGVSSALAGEIRTVNVQFKAHETGTTVKGSIKGRETIDYRLRAKAGQQMTVSLSTSNLSNYFNVLPPGSETALFVGSTSGNDWTGTLPADGDYTVRVYLMRSAARRNEKAKYTLSIDIAGGLGKAPASDAKCLERLITLPARCLVQSAPTRKARPSVSSASSAANRATPRFMSRRPEAERGC